MSWLEKLEIFALGFIIGTLVILFVILFMLQDFVFKFIR